MNVRDLRALLDGEGVRRDAYCLEGGDISDRYYLQPAEHGWSVYYLDERGLERRQRSFEDEDSACRYLLELLRSDPTTR